YKPDPEDLSERADLVIYGEDRGEDEDPTLKPVRILSDFCIFDPNHDMEVVSLDLLQQSDGVAGRHFEAAGLVSPEFLNEEDEGQEDGIDESQDFNFQRLRTSAILNFSFDYSKPDDPVYIQTEFSYYKLTFPSKIYRQCFADFLRPHRVAQLVICSALEDPDLSYNQFCATHLNLRDVNVGIMLQQADITAATAVIRTALEELEDGAQIVTKPLLKHILRGERPLSFNNRRRDQRNPTAKTRPPPRRPWHAGDLDLLVLRPENQTRTHVTPSIARLAEGLFGERLVVVGPRPKPIDNPSGTDVARKKARNLLWNMICECHKREQVTKHTRNVVFQRGNQIRDHHFKAVTVDGMEYKVGDVVLVRAGGFKSRRIPALPLKRDSLPEDAILADYFWFAKILYIDQLRTQFHVQWYEHSSKTMLQELGNPRELFLWNGCDDVDIRLVLGNIPVHHNCADQSTVGPSEYFCNLLYDPNDASFTGLEDSEFSAIAAASAPPDNCPICLVNMQKQQDQGGRIVTNGIVWQGINYHVGDYVLIRTDEGPADIGQIERIMESDIRAVRHTIAQLGICILGRVSDIMHICPATVLKDERHLFLTDIKLQVPVERIVQRCFVVQPETRQDLRSWLDASPYHFFVRYKFADLKPGSWAKKTKLSSNKVTGCKQCMVENEGAIAEESEFLSASRRRPLRALDLFGGVGAFGLGIESSGSTKVTHAIEISPSAARTLKQNSPGTIVYNQCANVVLQYAIKKQTLSDQDIEIPKIIDGSQDLPPPPKPGEIDVLIAGFPCQPHSTLNMFQKANDRKSHLILTLMAYVDYYKPKYVFLENVRGFLNYALKAVQANRHRVEGGVKQGGLQWLATAFIELGFQLRYGLLQAAHYGTPQSRIRFFLTASRRGLPLPLFPEPTHYFPVKDGLQIKFPDSESASAVRTANGVAPFRFVSIEDAIADLPPFHWSASTRTSEEPEQQVMELECKPKKPYCGLSGPQVEYYTQPRTSFQAKCRERPTADLQHYTRVLKCETIERVINIPLNPKADYRSLPVYLHEWQFSDPSSAVARNGFRPGMYGRLDAQAWFHTTVTNVEPTAKQSWVLHPWCKRVVTVRELARSQGFPDHFVFYAPESNVKTMQRQIGNAVPLPVGAAFGRELGKALLKKWKRETEEAILIE
ncbi:S-adenosyl-L-methionine-dependent methyltransferase, partial [Obba rivulosa]